MSKNQAAMTQQKSHIEWMHSRTSFDHIHCFKWDEEAIDRKVIFYLILLLKIVLDIILRLVYVTHSDWANCSIEWIYCSVGILTVTHRWLFDLNMSMAVISAHGKWKHYLVANNVFKCLNSQTKTFSIIEL